MVFAWLRKIVNHEATFKNYQMVVVQDRTLSYIHGFFLVSVILYELVYITFLYHQYASFEIPIGHANFYDGAVSQQAPRSDIIQYCGNSSYTWGFDLSEEDKIRAGGFAFNLSGPCIPFSRSKHTVMGTNIFSVVTQETTTYENGTVEQHMIYAPENAVLNMIHVLSASFYPTGIVNPPAHIRDANGNIIRSFESALPVSLTVKECIDIAGGNLDSRCPRPHSPARGCAAAR